MMTNLVSERSPSKLLSGKRPFEYGTSGARFVRGFKRPKVSAIRQFPPGCGPAARGVRETCNEGGMLDKTSRERSKAGPREPLAEMLPTKVINSDESMKPSVEMLPKKLKSEPMKPRVKVLPNELISDAIKPPALQGNTFFGNVDTRFLRVPEKVDLIKERNNNSIRKPIDMLCGSSTSPRPSSLLSKKYPCPKFRKGVTVIRDFPRGCGRRNLDVSSKCDVLPGNKSIDAEPGMFQAIDEKIKIDGAKSCRVVTNGRDSEEYISYKLSDGFTGAMVPVVNDSINVAHLDGGIVSAAEQGVRTSGCMEATGATDGCSDKKCKIIVNNGSHSLLLKHFDTKSNFVDMESGRYNALPDQKHNNALSVKASDQLRNNGHYEALCRTKSQEVLDLFQQTLNKRLLEIEHEEKSTGKKKTSNLYMDIAMILKDQKKWMYMNKKLLGAIPGIEIGDQFRYRAELVVVGLHIQFSAGIDYMEKDGKKIATSIVSSGRYSRDKELPDVLVYSGEGGNHIMGQKNSKDQALVRGNLALKNSMDEKSPVRVIRGRRSCKCATFTYDGLYLVTKFWEERAKNGNLVYLFQLNRMQGQRKLNSSTLQKVGKSKARHALMNDISWGKENIPIRVYNDIDDDKPPTFDYITKMIYPQPLVSLSGCHCIDGCSDHVQCSCIIKNGSMVPFNENGALLEAKPETIVHECGPWCKCPPSCKNRVSQHGIKFQLEVFKTKAKGWGVRSRNFILSGSFICEYVGELLNDKQAEERIGLDEYLFDIGDEDGFAIDAARVGNIGRFINHSCSPNLFAQDVLYDHDDKMMPHVMLFATQNIPPFRELTYHYNYKIDHVYDSNGNVKKKTCNCGDAGCTGRLY
ncbi:histone H3-K9 methyltransferase [Heracleum sosnowskyi]|uniref:Histone H3-K9 methyltransferase n=1 Tax=Heracleum sosnowskyi TaxID=360622 RepID=A0AAD8HLF8_9APIA|nr:histone H3-K9 methyltransferase [Heracleum sosnowskyi]